MTRHRAIYKGFLNGKNRFISSFELFNEYGIENCKIELIEYFKCDTLQELRRKEGEYIKNTACVNKRVEGRTIKEWQEDNKDKTKEYKKNWHEQNKDKINDHHKNYYQTNKDKINEKRREIYKLKKESDKVEHTE